MQQIRKCPKMLSRCLIFDDVFFVEVKLEDEKHEVLQTTHWQAGT
jgi:hypothetical protein